MANHPHNFKEQRIDKARRTPCQDLFIPKSEVGSSRDERTRLSPNSVWLLSMNRRADILSALDVEERGGAFCARSLGQVRQRQAGETPARREQARTGLGPKSARTEQRPVTFGFRVRRMNWRSEVRRKPSLALTMSVPCSTTVLMRLTRVRFIQEPLFSKGGRLTSPAWSVRSDGQMCLGTHTTQKLTFAV